MQQYYRLMKSILFVLFLSFGMISCVRKRILFLPLQLQGKRMTQLLIRQIPIRLILLFVRIMNKRCSCIYPGRTISLLFYQNIADLKKYHRETIY